MCVCVCVCAFVCVCVSARPRACVCTALRAFKDRRCKIKPLLIFIIFNTRSTARVWRPCWLKNWNTAFLTNCPLFYIDPLLFWKNFLDSFRETDWEKKTLPRHEEVFLSLPATPSWSRWPRLFTKHSTRCRVFFNCTVAKLSQMVSLDCRDFSLCSWAFNTTGVSAS